VSRRRLYVSGGFRAAPAAPARLRQS
jgi:hypothetical protein